jgi:hypothetical protein
MLGLQGEPTFLVHRYVVGHPKPQSGDVGLVAVLFEKHPLKDLCPSEAVIGYEGSALRHVKQDSVRLGEEASILSFEHRHPVVQVHLLEELWGPRLGLVDLVLHPLERYAELREEQAHLVAVPRGEVVVQSDHVCLPCQRPAASMLTGRCDQVHRHAPEYVETEF